MVHKDSLNSFFEKQTMYNYTYSFATSLSSNAYSFSNICNMISLMAMKKNEGLKSDPYWTIKHPNWNKVLLVPVTSSASGIEHDMSLSSTRLVGGKNNPYDPVTISVVYAKFTEK